MHENSQTLTNFYKHRTLSSSNTLFPGVYLVQPDTFAMSNAVPAGHVFGTPKNEQQLIVSVIFCISITAILWCVSLSVRRHPDLQAPYSLLVMIEFLQCVPNTTVRPSI